MLKGTAPHLEHLEEKPQDLWYYWSRFDKLAVEGGILCLRTPVGDGPDTILRAVVPRAARQEILELAHGSRVGGHFRVQKTIEKFKMQFYWLQIAKDVKYWCENFQHAIGIRLTRGTVMPLLQFTLEHHLSASQ